MKKDYTICNKTILENEVIEETSKELEELNKIFFVSVDKMTDSQRKRADKYIEDELKRVDDFINSYLSN